MAEIKEEDHVASRALKDHPQVKKKSINPLANSSASGAPTIVLSMNEEERTPINKSKLGQEPEGVSMPGEAAIQEAPAGRQRSHEDQHVRIIRLCPKESSLQQLPYLRLVA